MNDDTRNPRPTAPRDVSTLKDFVTDCPCCAETRRKVAEITQFVSQIYDVSGSYPEVEIGEVNCGICEMEGKVLTSDGETLKLLLTHDIADDIARQADNMKKVMHRLKIISTIIDALAPEKLRAALAEVEIPF